MGLDLTLLPFDGEIDAETAFSHTMLPMDRDRYMTALLRISTRPVPDRFRSYTSRERGDEPSYGITTTTPYGERLEYVTAREFLNVCAALDMGVGSRTHAALAYLRELDPDTKVALYWH